MGDGSRLAGGRQGASRSGPPRRRLERFVKPNDPVSEITTVVGFSPDSQWLLSRTNSTWAQRLQFWRTGTWETGQRADVNCRGGAFQAPVFTADGQLMALGIAADQVLLADATTGRELVRLTTLRPIVPDAAGLQPRQHEAGRRHLAEDRSCLGSAANPRPARLARTGLGRAARIPRPTRRKPLPAPFPHCGECGSSAKFIGTESTAVPRRGRSRAGRPRREPPCRCVRTSLVRWVGSRPQFFGRLPDRSVLSPGRISRRSFFQIPV